MITLRLARGRVILGATRGGYVMPAEPLNLTGKLLIAMPGMQDFRFEHAVIFMCAYSDEGAMGLIVNKRAADLSLRDVLNHLEIEQDTGKDRLTDLPVHFGGPVETQRGFVLHSGDYRSALQTLEVAPDFAMTSTQDILEDISKGEGPAQALLMLGYAGWGPGQLEGELAQNGWLTTDATAELLFETPDAQKWEAALALIGVDPMGLSAVAGRA